VWSVKCNRASSAPDDPIVFPAQPGRSHLHDFFGNVSVKADTTTASLLDAGSTCLKGMNEVDRAAYWTPALLANGRPVTGPADELRIDAYYSVSDKPLPVRSMPVGLRMIAGDSKAQRPQSTDIVHYNCLHYPQGGEVTRSSSAIPTCPAGSYLSAKIVFPGCWDGSNLDSADHKSHMAYGSFSDGERRCPANHPVAVPAITFSISWPIANGTGAKLASGPVRTMHGDVFSVWDPGTLAGHVAQCLQADVDCGSK
jgi:hypothetical protein